MNGWRHPVPEGWEEQAWAALEEDLGPGDLSAVCLDEDTSVAWTIEAQAEGVLCGVGIAAFLLEPEADSSSEFFCDIRFEDGSAIGPGDAVLTGRSRATQVLSRERTALNFLMHLSGVATLTRRFVERVEGLDVSIVDTRKTVPGLRILQKYAVRCGGGRNHRLGLFDAVMVKDNHIEAAGSITGALSKARASVGHTVRIEVECETPDQVEEAVKAGADIVLLDNMDPFTMSAIAREFRDRVILEASGGVTLETVRPIAATGVHVVSVGALTHSAAGLPFHLEVG